MGKVIEIAPGITQEVQALHTPRDPKTLELLEAAAQGNFDRLFGVDVEPKDLRELLAILGETRENIEITLRQFGRLRNPHRLGAVIDRVGRRVERVLTWARGEKSPLEEVAQAAFREQGQKIAELVLGKTSTAKPGGKAS